MDTKTLVVNALAGEKKLRKEYKKRQQKVAEVFDCPFKHLDDSKQEFAVALVGDLYQVVCKVCGSMGPRSETPEGAVEEWNKRDILVVDEEHFKLLQKKV